MASQISSYDRMHFAFFLAAVVHAILIFGIGFVAPKPGLKAPSLDVTLAVHRSEKEPKEADFLAQANQEGSGVLDEKALLSTTEIADFFDNSINEVQTEQPQWNQQLKAFEKAQITTTERSNQSAHSPQQDNQEIENQTPQSSAKALLAQSIEIASLEAQLREKRQAYAKRPRKKTLTTLSAKSSADAAYLDGWRRKVELTGNAQYTALGVGRLTGSLRMLVAVKADGTIHDVKILEPSGHRQLDDAALRVVRLAAPFERFPESIRKETDILEIIRTWRFEKGNYLTSQQ